MCLGKGVQAHLRYSEYRVTGLVRERARVDGGVRKATARARPRACASAVRGQRVLRGERDSPKIYRRIKHTVAGVLRGDYRYAREDKGVEVQLLLFESFGRFGKGVREILRKAADVLQNKLTRAQYLDEVTWTTKSWLGLQKQRISVVLHTAIAEQESLRRLPWQPLARHCTRLLSMRVGHPPRQHADGKL
ncbi:hypothetical protein EMIHUDRAFT_225348 [Emiliania huxleyi CCMP1516]|uniref:Uncharacterized protein n=2 Tax=Emiliania huxleyi TaxID=2903 RepID=A0A0D3KP10_EMIH1|nr:hypothetical protein EMIHUDRAFT_225348 [Emiliania huxleyi CCMP1516]EOD37495.1 hypothetical protein EMIHUDRAFT_225348 [Emiliania huxleyi CCMP1516]|eukprot:XP_005789924.1 hypothetical protein EMIHUDRAFT_225348 [Emiliania huxleyi CCMP1516]